MHLFLVSIAIVVFASGILFKSININSNEVKDLSQSPQVLNVSDEKSPEPIASDLPTPSPDPVVTPTVTVKDSKIEFESTLVYPNADKISEGNFVTNDDADLVTDWYKNQIRSLNYNVKNFVSTTVNGVVKNELVAANSEKELRILITKSSDSKTTEISFK